RQYQYDARRQQGDGGGVFGDSQFTSTLSVNFHFPKIPRRTFLLVTKRALPQAGLLPQVDNDAVLPVHNVVAVVSWRYKPLLAKEGSARGRSVRDGYDMEERSLGLRFYC
ncbi:hypothetical protein, partial [Aeromonas caviae]|uniref:hypothetical protein n=1 Tax=Aeromonas caviae TaxID=648 RepID=UPI0038D1059E